MEGGKNGMELYGEVTIEKHSFDIAKKRLGDEGNTATIGKYAFAIAGEGNTTSIEKGIIVEIGRRNGEGNLSYAKSRSEQYDKPKRQLSDEGRIAPHRPLDPFR